MEKLKNWIFNFLKIYLFLRMTNSVRKETELVVVVKSGSLSHKFILIHGIFHVCVFALSALQPVLMGSFAIELRFLEISRFNFIIKLESNFLIEVGGSSCCKYALSRISLWEPTFSKFSQSFSFRNEPWSFLISLEIHKSVGKRWFTRKSTWRLQYWINVWFQLVSKAVNRV